ncbi:hypothetical protein U1769_14570 [Sphingomonas sp. ZT3P38]|uniref:hypothetical protein n=1 Tax=Parasphingomonas zepuensis TaxID=3096161 RepID=UPI002FC75840
MLLLPLLLLSQTGEADCAAELRLDGVGKPAAVQVEAYADCLNGHMGTEIQLRSSCEGPRGIAADYHGPAKAKERVALALRWLDSMVRERAVCETHLKVGS